MTNPIEMLCRDEGAGTPSFVFIHGLSSDLTDWQPQLAVFSETNRVIAPTLRGHGSDVSDPSTLTMESLAADVVELIRDREIPEAIVAGHSMGTRVAHEVWRQAPEVVKGLILVDGSDFALGDLDAAMAGFEAAASGEKLKPFLQGIFEGMFFGDAFADLRDACVKRALAMPDENFRALFRSMMSWDAIHSESVMRTVNVPTLVVQSTTRGEDGIRRPLNSGEMSHFPSQVKERNAHAEFSLIADHGHFIGMEAPDWTNDAIRSWAQRNKLI